MIWTWAMEDYQIIVSLENRRQKKTKNMETKYGNGGSSVGTGLKMLSALVTWNRKTAEAV